MTDRVANRDAIDAEVAAWLARTNTADALDRLVAHHVVAGRVNDIADVLGDSHIAARAAIATIVDQKLGPMRMPAPVPKLSDTPGEINWTGEDPGASNDEVFAAWCGLSDSEIATLKSKNVI